MPNFILLTRVYDIYDSQLIAKGLEVEDITEEHLDKEPMWINMDTVAVMKRGTLRDGCKVPVTRLFFMDGEMRVKVMEDVPDILELTSQPSLTISGNPSKELDLKQIFNKKGTDATT